MPKLHEVLAIEKGVKNRSYGVITELDKLDQKVDLFYGFDKIFQPLVEDQGGDHVSQPPQRKTIQCRALEHVDTAKKAMIEILDITAMKDITNTKTTATVQIGDQVVIEAVPVSYLLFLEKQLKDIADFIRRIPTLDPSVDWKWSDETNCYIAPMTWTNSTKKQPRVITLAEATEHHPAQTHIEYEDVPVGKWETTRYSSALPAALKSEMLDRCIKLWDAVKQARERANAVEATKVDMGAKIMNYVLGR